MCTSRYLMTMSGILKLVELVFAITGLGIYRGAELVFFGNHTLAIDTLFSGFFVAAIIISTILLICYLVGQTPNLQQTFLEPLANLTLFVGLAAVGGVGVYWQHENGFPTHKQEMEGYATASMAFCAAIAYLLDFIYSVIKYKK